MWIAIGGVVVILAVIWAAYAVGRSHGKTDQQRVNAEVQAEDMAHGAAVATQPPVDAPFSAMKGK